SRCSVRLGPYGLGARRTPALQAGGRRLGRPELLVGKHANRRLGFVFDLGLAGGATAPAGVNEPALAVHQIFEVVVADAMTNAVLFATLSRRDEHVVLDAHQQLGDILTDRVERHGSLLAVVASNEHGLVLLEVAGPELHAERDPSQLPLVVLGARLDPLAIVDVHSQTAGISPLP